MPTHRFHYESDPTQGGTWFGERGVRICERSDGERAISTKLYWQPVRRVKTRTLGIGLRWALQSRCGQHFAATTMGSQSIQFLQGVGAAARSEDVKRDCKVLLEAIEKFGSIELWVDE